MSTMELSDVGVVIIGRNEGLRLVKCLESLVTKTKKLVYVDSGSNDNSVKVAQDMNISVVNLDMTIPFTAARARNEGFELLIKSFPDLKYVQFVDGDCEVNPTWLYQAIKFLEMNPRVAVVCGRRRERYPGKSIYNLMCDIEWNTPIGEAKYCGGDALMRSSIFKETKGFNAGLIAGEEPELCVRIRKLGWKVWRIDEEMTLHDAAMSRFAQWWKRSVRAGHAYAEGVYIHGEHPENHWVKECRRAWLWAGFIPLFIILLLVINPNYAYVLFLIYPIQIIRIALQNKRPHSFKMAFFLVLGKFAELVGQFKFLKNMMLGQKIKLIEYK